jgi:cell shape-determining protein MreD
MTSWLERRAVWQYALILLIGSVLCELLVFAILDSLGHRSFDITLFTAAAVGVALVGMPGPVWQQKKRRETAAQQVADTQH